MKRLPLTLHGRDDGEDIDADVGTDMDADMDPLLVSAGVRFRF